MSFTSHSHLTSLLSPSLLSYSLPPCYLSLLFIIVRWTTIWLQQWPRKGTTLKTPTLIINLPLSTASSPHMPVPSAASPRFLTSLIALFLIPPFLIHLVPPFYYPFPPLSSPGSPLFCHSYDPDADPAKGPFVWSQQQLLGEHAHPISCCAIDKSGRLEIETPLSLCYLTYISPTTLSIPNNLTKQPNLTCLSVCTDTSSPVTRLQPHPPHRQQWLSNRHHRASSYGT